AVSYYTRGSEVGNRCGARSTCPTQGSIGPSMGGALPSWEDSTKGGEEKVRPGVRTLGRALRIEVHRHTTRMPWHTRVDTLSMKSPCTHRGCRDLVFASVEDVTEKLPTFLLVDILGCGFDWNAVADQLSTHFQYCS